MSAFTAFNSDGLQQRAIYGCLFLQQDFRDEDVRFHDQLERFSAPAGLSAFAGNLHRPVDDRLDFPRPLPAEFPPAHERLGAGDHPHDCPVLHLAEAVHRWSDRRQRERISDWYLVFSFW